MTGCDVAATIDNPAGVENEELGAPVWLCEGTVAPWSEIWPEFRRLG